MWKNRAIPLPIPSWLSVFGRNTKAASFTGGNARIAPKVQRTLTHEEY